MTETQTTRDVPNAEVISRLGWEISDFARFNRGNWELLAKFAGKRISETLSLAVTGEPVSVRLASGDTTPNPGAGIDGLVEKPRCATHGVAPSQTLSQTPTDTSRKPESGVSGCGGAEEAKTA